MVRRHVALLLLALLALPLLSGCWNKVEIEEAAYVLAVGVDKGEEGRYMVTVALARPDKLAGKNEGGGGGDKKEKPVVLTSVQAPSLVAALSMMNGFTGRRINLSHARALFLHEELARTDGLRILDELLRFRESRRTIFFIVTRDPAKRFLNEMEPKLEKNPMKYVEQLTYQYRLSGVTPHSSQVNNLAMRLNANFAQPVAYYAALAGEGGDTDTQGAQGAKESQGAQGSQGPQGSQAETGFQAGELPRTGGANVELLGAAAFRGSQMVGVLTGEETRYMLMLQDQFRRAYTTFQDPEEPSRFVSVLLSRGRPTQFALDLSGDRPRITGRITLEAELVAIQSGVDYSEPEKQPVLEQAIAQQIKTALQAMVARTQSWETDVVGFGRHAVRHFASVEAWERYDWPTKFPKATIDIDVRVTLRRFGLTLSPVETK